MSTQELTIIARDLKKPRLMAEQLDNEVAQLEQGVIPWHKPWTTSSPAISHVKFKSNQLLSLTVSPLCFFYTVRPQSMLDIGCYGILSFIAFSGAFYRMFATFVGMANPATP